MTIGKWKMEAKCQSYFAGELTTGRAVATIGIILLPLVYFFPALTGDLSLVQGDGWTANLGLRIFTGRMIAQGIFPLWNPYLFAGMPHLASIYPGVLYPPNWLFVVLPPGIAINVVVITTYHLALTGAYRYARCLEIDRLGAIITGVVFSFGGYMVMSMGQTSNIATAAWLPWILLAIEKLHKRATWRWVALGSIFISLQFFAGVPQVTWYTALVGGAYFFFSAVMRPQNQPGWRFIIGALGMAMFGALLSAIQLLPLHEMQQFGGRAKISYEYFAAFSFPPRQAVALVFPFFFGGASSPPYRIPYWGESGIFITCGYVGLLSILLGLAAVIGARKRPLVWFWAGLAMISLTLSFGDYLPFGLNHWLYQIPVYNLFRASFRHTFEFTFSCAVLAGVGANYLSHAGRNRDKKTMALASSVILTAIVIFTLAAYALFGQKLSPNVPKPRQSDSLLNIETLTPLFFFVASVIALWCFTLRQSKLSKVLLVLILLADLLAYGHYLEWRAYTFNVADRLADPPTVQEIKARENDPNSFRILSYSSQPFGTNYEMLNYPNNSIARGLQSANGYDMLRLQRPSEVLGDMTSEGVVQNHRSFELAHQGFNLFNIKYLLVERNRPLDPTSSIVYDGVCFESKSFEQRLISGSRIDLFPEGAIANELAIVSTMSSSTHISDGEPIVKISLHTKNRQVIERDLLIGRDTSEWAYDRADVKSDVKHSRARIIESWPVPDQAGGFEGHRYLARLPFEKVEIEKIVLQYLRPEAEILITRASLYDSTNGLSYPIDALRLTPERWRKLANFGAVDLYQNLKSMPRAWFVKRVVVKPSAEVHHSIKEGKDTNGQPFNPTETALLEQEDVEDHDVPPQPSGSTTNAEVVVTRYASQRIHISTRSTGQEFLVLSEVYYPGWEARVDGVKTKIYPVNHALRGILIPPGEHQVEFVYAAPRVRTGFLCSGLAALFLFAGICYNRWKSSRSA
jgi:Bacterial membrane protein YfhO